MESIVENEIDAPILHNESRDVNKSISKKSNNCFIRFFKRLTPRLKRRKRKTINDENDDDEHDSDDNDDDNRTTFCFVFIKRFL